MQYEIIFCIGELRNGPSLPIIQELAALYPTINVRIFQGKIRTEYTERENENLYIYLLVQEENS